MAIEIVTFFSKLLELARAQTNAEKNGTPEEIRRATEEHEQYRRLCLRADKMVIPKIKN